MTVKKKAERERMVTHYSIEDVINRGGKVTEDEIGKSLEEEVRFTLRISQNLIRKIDEDRSKRIGNISRNQWIIEAIAEKL